MIQPVAFTLNGKPVRLEVDGDRALLWVLRYDLGLTGAKFGCGEGLCGACTVLVGGDAVYSCQTTIGALDGADVVTIEGLAQPDGTLHPLQEAFVRQDALQCGFCTPGMILRAYGLLKKTPRPSPREISDGMEGHLCRCGAHVRIIAAIEEAAATMRGETR